MTREDKAKLIQDVADWVKNNYPLDEEINKRLIEVGHKIVMDGIESKAAFVQAFAMNDQKQSQDPQYQTGRQLILSKGYAATRNIDAVKYYVRVNNI